MQTNHIGDLFREGQLGHAIVAANIALQREPGDIDTRMLLSELLLFDGDLLRADAMLDATSRLDPEMAIVIAEFRQLLHAELTRREVLSGGRLPEFLGQPTAAQTLVLQGLAALRAHDTDGAIAAMQAAENARPAVSGSSNGVTFGDFRDADDLFTGTFEILTVTGKYFWIPTERVVSMTLHPPKRPRDLFWRRCTMDVRDGPDGQVYLPALYPCGHETGDRLRLGLETAWTEAEPVRGIGQRIFLAGDDGVAVQELTTLEFA